MSARVVRLMPFGKHRGVEIKDLPNDYLAWLLTIELRQPLAGWVEEEANRRWGEESAPANVSEGVGEMAMRIITAGYRACALKSHPDRGGDSAEMADLNAAMEVLRRYVKEELL